MVRHSRKHFLEAKDVNEDTLSTMKYYTIIMTSFGMTCLHKIRDGLGTMMHCPNSRSQQNTNNHERENWQTFRESTMRKGKGINPRARFHMITPWLP